MKHRIAGITALWLSAALLVTAPHTVCAGQSLFGPTGLVLNPTADIAPQGLLETTVSYISQTTPANIDVNQFTLVGVGGAGENMEFHLGLSTFNPSGAGAPSGDSGVTAGLKYQLMPESATTPGVAFGASVVDVGQNFEQYGLYAVVTKELTPSDAGYATLRGSIGVRWDDVRYLQAVNRVDDFTLFVGGELRMAPQFALVGEVQTGHDATTDTPYAALVRFDASEKLTLEAGIINTGIDSGAGFVLGVNYRFGGVGWK